MSENQSKTFLQVKDILRLKLAAAIMLGALLVTGSTHAAKKAQMRFEFSVAGGLIGEISPDDPQVRPSVTTRKQVGIQGRLPWLDLNEAFDDMTFRESGGYNGSSVDGDECFKDEDQASQMNISWDQDGGNIRAGIFVGGFADDGATFDDRTGLLYFLDLFADGTFSNGLPIDLPEGQATSFVASQWLLTPEARGKLKKSTCVGASMDDVNPLGPLAPVSIVITRMVNE